MGHRRITPFAVCAAAVIAVTTTVLAVIPWPCLKAPAALILDVVLPGILLYRLVFRRSSHHTVVDAVLISAGLGYSLMLCATLVLHYVPGPLTRRLALICYGSFVGLLLVANVLWPYEGRVTSLKRRDWWAIVALCVGALILRLVNLAYSEFQGDEVAVLHKAAAAIQGRDDVLFLHRKGPAEILTVLLPYAQGMAINEWGARLPFAVANVLGVLAFYQLGAKGFGQGAGLWAGLLALLNGFFVAFGRIVQYQSFVLLFSALGVLMALAYAADGDRRYLWLSALFLAAGLLAHSDTAFAILPAVWLILRAQAHARLRPGDIVRHDVGPFLMAAAILALFYVPYITSASFGKTAGYLSLRMGSEAPYNNLDHLLDISTVYNAIYYLALVGAVALWATLRRTGSATPLRWVVPLALAALLVQSALWDEAWLYREHDWIGLLFLALFAVAVCGHEDSILGRPTLLWLGVPFILYMFWFDDPRTHVYACFPGAILLVGEQLAIWQTALGRRKWVVSTASVPFLAMATAYLVIALVSHTPEYKRTYPEHRIKAFWVPFGDVMPEQGLFGFPYRVGWKVVGELYDQGMLSGDYSTNEEQHITRWYTRAASACDSEPRYYILAANVQDEQKVPRETIASKYELVGEVRERGIPTLEIYELKPAKLTYQEYDAVAMGRDFDRRLSDPWYDAGQGQTDKLAEMQISLGVRFGDRIELVGYAVRRVGPRPQDVITVSLFWRALAPIDRSYTAFVHIEDPGVVWVQKDAVPRCGDADTTEWVVDDIVVDRHALWLDGQVPQGPHALVVGLYDSETGKRLPVTDAYGQPSGDIVTLGTIDIYSEK